MDALKLSQAVTPTEATFTGMLTTATTTLLLNIEEGKRRRTTYFFRCMKTLEMFTPNITFPNFFDLASVRLTDVSRRSFSWAGFRFSGSTSSGGSTLACVVGVVLGVGLERFEWFFGVWWWW